MTRTCAICANLATEGAMEPLGRDDALVFVCATCSGERPQAWDSERAYEAPNTPGCTYDMIKAGAERISAPPRGDSRVSSYGELVPGFVLVRYPRRIDGEPVTHDEAYQALRARFPVVLALGKTVHHYLFQRPAAADFDAIEWLKRNATRTA